MPRLKYTKLQGMQAFICWHPSESMIGPIDDMGIQRCGRCFHRVMVMLTRKAFDKYVG